MAIKETRHLLVSLPLFFSPCQPMSLQSQKARDVGYFPSILLSIDWHWATNLSSVLEWGFCTKQLFQLNGEYAVYELCAMCWVSSSIFNTLTMTCFPECMISRFETITFQGQPIFKEQAKGQRHYSWRASVQILLCYFIYVYAVMIPIVDIALTQSLSR